MNRRTAIAFTPELKSAKADEQDVELKELAPLQIKDEAKGEVEAIVATIGVVDKDEDIIAVGAIKDGAKVKVSAYGHDAIFGSAPVGKGTLSVDGNKIVFKGRLFLTTSRGIETFQVLKEMGAEQQWSFGFRVMGQETPDDAQRGKGARRILTKLDAFEVSPVIIGAGVGTRTVAVKEEKSSETPPPPPPAPTAEEIETKRLADEQAETDRKARYRDEQEYLQRVFEKSVKSSR